MSITEPSANESHRVNQIAKSDPSIKLAVGVLYPSAQGLVFRSPKTGETCLAFALSDIDGTINNEHAPESERLSTIAPAAQAITELRRVGIPVGICTARAHGEAITYAHAVGAEGFIVSENGACLTDRHGAQQTIGSLEEVRECIEVIEMRIGRRVASTLTPDRLERAWREQRAPHSQSKRDLGHTTLEELRLSTIRLASAYVSGLTHEERVVANDVAQTLGFAPFGDLLHIISKRASKGVAVEALCVRLAGEALILSTDQGEVLTQPTRIIPIVFGNGENDLPLFETAAERGGLGVLVADPVKVGGYHFDVELTPPHPKTITTPGAPYGYGMLASLPQIAKRFSDEYGVTLDLGPPSNHHHSSSRVS